MSLRGASAALRRFGQEIQSAFSGRAGNEVEKFGCMHCKKVCDPKQDTYILINVYGDYVCSQQCKLALEDRVRDEFHKSLGVPLGRDKKKYPYQRVKAEPEPEKPFNRYRALIDNE